MGDTQLFSDNDIISSRQVTWILSLDILAAGLFWLPALYGRKSFGEMLCLGAVTLLLVFAYFGGAFLWMNRAGRMNAPGRIPDWLQIFIRAFFLFYYLIAAVYAVQIFHGVVDALIAEDYVWPVPVIFLLTAAAYSAGKGIEIRGRMAELLGWLVFVPFILFFVAGFWQAFRNGWPEFELSSVNWGGLLPGSYVGAFFFLMGDHPIILQKYMRVDGKKKNVFWYGLVGSCLLVFAGLVLTGVYLTPEGAAREAQPFGILLQMIRFPGNFISRYDVFFIMVWMLAFYNFAGGMLLHAVEMASLLWNKIQSKNNHKHENRDMQAQKRWLALWGGLLVLLLACLTRQWDAFDELVRRWMLWAGVPVSIILIVIDGIKWKKVEK